jgi:hypothetical protein
VTGEVDVRLSQESNHHRRWHRWALHRHRLTTHRRRSNRLRAGGSAECGWRRIHAASPPVPGNLTNRHRYLRVISWIVLQVCSLLKHVPIVLVVVLIIRSEAKRIAFILDRKIMAPTIWLEGLWRSCNLQEICCYRGASYIKLGFSIYVGYRICNARARIMVRQTYSIHCALGMVYAQAGWDSGR